MIQSVSKNQAVPSVVVGIGSEVPATTQPDRFRQKFNVHGPFVVYVGRIDENKGCKELFEFFDAYLRAGVGNLSLVLIGNSILPIPDHPRVRHLGFVDDRDKFDGVSGAELLVMPSYYESLSMVALEAWALGRPVLANGRCDVLKGQCIRSNAGLYYETEAEFVDALQALERNRWMNNALGRNGRLFFRENYDWPIIERKYLEMLRRLSAESVTARPPWLPGWFSRRADNCAPAADALKAIPRGPSLTVERTPFLQRPPVSGQDAGLPFSSGQAPAGTWPDQEEPVSERRVDHYHRRGGPQRRRSAP